MIGYSPYLRRYCPTCGGITCIEPKNRPTQAKVPLVSFIVLLGGSFALLTALLLVKQLIIK